MKSIGPVRVTGRCLAGGTALAFAIGPLHAQSVEIVLREDSTRVPIAGAIVRLIGEGAPIIQSLSNDAGRVNLRAARAGVYRIRIDRIGRSPVHLGPVTLDSGQTLRQDVLLSAPRVVLPTLSVRVRNRCSARRHSDAFAQAVWEEIHKALTASIISHSESRTRLQVREFVREVHLSGEMIRSWVTAVRHGYGQPFVSLPPSRLLRHGFVREEADSLSFAAPDAVLLLSTEFASSHCFYPVVGDGDLVGLVFEPVPDRDVPDIRGTLWVDRVSSELRYLQFSYTDLPEYLQGSDLGGRVEFRLLPGGRWIVSYWHIRMPRLQSRFANQLSGSAKVRTVNGYWERGGTAVVAPVGQADVFRAVVAGLVFDSTLGRGLAGAAIRLEGIADSTVTDEDGRFRFDVRVSGPQVVTARHPKLELLGEPPNRRIVLSVGDTATVEFGVPGTVTFAKALCGASQGRSGIVGLAMDEQGRAREGLTVVSSWFASSTDFTVEGTNVRSIADASDRGGLFALCDLQVHRDLPVLLLEGKRRLASWRVFLEKGEHRWLELDPRKDP
ncbi:MAG: carboxypeptidase-like regulatory domain-containing protein [bacterium]